MTIQKLEQIVPLGFSVSFLISVFFGCSQTNVDRPHPPRLVIDTRKLDFGSIEPSIRPIRREVVIKNGGDQTLRITSIDTGCDCLRMSMASDGIPPGQEYVGTFFLSTRKPGQNEAILTLKSNDPFNEVVVLRCSWFVEVKYRFDEPDRLIGDFQRGDPFEITAAVVSADSTSFVNLRDNGLSIETSPPPRIRRMRCHRRRRHCPRRDPRFSGAWTGGICCGFEG